MARKGVLKTALTSYDRLIFAVLLAAVLLPLLLFAYYEVAARFGELSMFLYDRSYFNEVALRPGGFLEYISAFIAQILIAPWLGILLAVLLWEAVYWLSLKAYDIPKGYSAIALLPVALLLLTVMGYGDKVNVLLYRNVFYTATLGYIACLGILILCKGIRNFPVKIVAIVAAGAAGYALFGAYGLFGALLASLSQVSKERSTGKALISIVIAAVILCLMKLAVSQNSIAGVPIVEYYNYDRVNVMPYILLCACSVLLVLLFRGDGQGSPAPASGKALACDLGVLTASILLCCLLWEADADYRTETKMYSAVMRQDWPKVVKLFDDVVKRDDAANAKSYKKLQDKVRNLGGDERKNLFNNYYGKEYRTPSRLMTEFRMLALQYMGQSGNQLFSAPQGWLSEKDTPFVSQYGPTIYRHWGLFNSSYVWTTASAIHGGWTYYNLKEAAVSMLLSGNAPAATKYLDILDNTLFYRKWSAAQRKYIEDDALLHSDFAQAYSLVCPRDEKFYSENGEIELKIMEHFALFDQPDVEVMTPEYAECSLMWAMLSKDNQVFWQALDNYYGVCNPATLPRYYQQAAYLFSVLEGSGIADNLPIDEEVVRQYDAFATYMTTHQGSVTELRQQSYKRFGKTFFYFYFFVDYFIE